MTQSDLDDRLIQSHVSIFGHPHWCWLTQVVLLGRRYFVDSIPLKVPGVDGEVRVTALPTAATDGYHVWYSTDFMQQVWDKHGLKGIRMIVLHENLHKAFRHQITWRALQKADPERTAYAADVVVNNLLAETPDFCSNPKDVGGIMRPDFAGLNVGEVWDRLASDPEYQSRQKGNGGKGEGDSAGFDVHLQPGDVEGENAEDNPTEQEISVQVQMAVQNGQYMQRQLHPQLADRFTELLKPQVDWREVLSQWMQGRTWGHDLADWHRPSRRSGSLGMFMPRHYAERTGRLCAAVDVSGSISAQQLGQFLGEVAALCKTLKPVGVDVVYWDGCVEGVEHYDASSYDTMASSFAPKGGGCTELGVAVDWLLQQKEDYRGAIVLTDGYLNGWHESRWPCDVLAIVNTNQPCPLPHTRIQ